MTNPTLKAAARWLPAFAVAAMLPAAAFAQNAVPLPPIDVTGAPTNQEAVYQAPAAVSTVSEGEIDIFGSQKIDSVLRTMPGVFTRDSVNQPGTSVNIRGFEGSGRVTMMIDGVRQNFRFTGHEAGGFLYVDSQLLAGIDIQRGTVVGAGGTGSLAGTANFRTIGIDDILLPGKMFGALNTTTFGTNGTGFMNMIAGAAKISPNVAFAGAFGFRNSHVYKNGNGQFVEFAGEQELTSGLFKLDLAPTDTSTLKFGYVRYDNVFSANSYLQNVTADTFTVKYAYKPNELIDFKFNVNANNVDMVYLRGLNNFATSVGRRIQDRGIGFDTSNTSRFQWGDILVRSQTGFEYFHDDFKTINGGVNPNAQTALAGIYNQTTFSRGIFDLTAGLRYDLFTVKGDGAVLVPGPFLPVGPYSIDREDGRLNPKITLAARVTPWFQPFITYAESMRAPTSFEMLVGGNHPGTPGNSGTSYIPNPFLEPEIQKGIEVGANFVRDNLFTNGDAARAKVVYFHQNVQNYIVYCSGPSGLPPPDPASFNWFCNAPGTSQVNGVELQATYDAGFAFAGLTYTYINTDLPTQTPGFGASQYLPDHNVVLTLGGRFLEKRLTAGLRAYFVSGGDDPSYDFTLQTQRPGYQLLDLFAEYTIRPGWSVSATLINVFDETYTPMVGTPPSSGCVSFIPGGCPPTPESGRGRTFVVSSKLQF